MNILVTGATGFIGRYLIKKLINIDCNIFALDRRKRSNIKSLNSDRLVWIPKGLENLNAFDLDKINVVIHLAAVGVSPQKANLEDLEYYNVYQSLRLIKLAKESGVKRFIAAGTCLEYGEESDKWDFIPPYAKLKPLCAYSKSKAKSFKLLNEYSIKNNIELFYGRIFSAYGEGQYEYNFWPLLRKAAISGKDFKMTKGEEIRDYLHVKNVANYFANAIFRNDINVGKPIIVNIGSGHPIKLKDFAQNEWERLKAKGEIHVGALKNRNYSIKRMVANIENLNYL